MFLDEAAQGEGCESLSTVALTTCNQEDHYYAV